MLPSAVVLADLCRRAEAGGAGALWVCDHLFWHGPALEALSALGVAATATTRAAIGTCILQLPLRHAPVGRQGGRLARPPVGWPLVLGVGVGTHPGEYAAAGVEFGTRGRRLDEGIDTLRRAVGGGTRRALRAAAGAVAPSRCGSAGRAKPLCVAPRAAATAGSRCSSPPASTARPWVASTKRRNGSGRDPGAVARAMVAFVSVGASGADERGLAWMASLYGLPARSFERHLVAGQRPDAARGTGALRRRGGTTHRRLRHLGRPAGTVRGPGRRVRRPPRVPFRPADDASCSRPARVDTPRRGEWSGVGSARVWRPTSGTQVVDPVWR